MGQFLLCLVVLAASFVPVIAAAETEIIEAQQRLNTKAAEASKSGDYRKAAELLQASLELGEFNIIYLNLGRVLQKDERCEASRAAYESALTAPSAPGVPLEKVRVAVERYQQELGRSCRARLVVRCQPTGVSLRLDGGGELACGVPIMLPSGAYRLQATRAMDVQNMDIVLADREDKDVDVVFSVDANSGNHEVDRDDENEDELMLRDGSDRAPRGPGWTTQDTVVVTVGALALAGVAGGFYFHSAASDDVELVGDVVRSETPFRDDYDFLVDEIRRKEAWMWGSFSAGGVLGALSLALFLVDFEEPASANLEIGRSDDGWSVFLGGSF
jgi:hypothetical protein